MDSERDALGGDAPVGRALEDLFTTIAHRFKRPEVRARARAYLGALIRGGGRKNGTQVAVRLGEEAPDGVQRLLNAACWDADAVRDDLSTFVGERLGHSEATLVVLETRFAKRGTKSVGVHRRTTGQWEPEHQAGTGRNGQTGIFLAYVAPGGCAFIDRALYLPRRWADDPARRAEAGIPSSVAFSTRDELATSMLRRAAATAIPARCVVVDAGNPTRMASELEQEGRPYLIAVDGTLAVEPHGACGMPLARLIDSLPPSAWMRVPDACGAPRDWATVMLSDPGGAARRRIAMALRPSADSQVQAYYLAGVLTRSSPETLAWMARTHQIARQSLAAARQRVGLGDYEVRRWVAWHRHVTLALLAHAVLEIGTGARFDHVDGPTLRKYRVR